jgi:putative hydrolase of the HAD superfamily
VTGAATLFVMIADARAGGFNLIFDADDTLWDSNIHFLEAEAAFLQALRRAGIEDHVEIRASIRRHELGIIAEVGYGRRPYAIALHRAAVELLPAHHHRPIRVEIEQIGRNLLSRHCELLPGVEPTLRELARRHRLLLFTKGQPEEQIGKLERSGLRSLFSRIGIPIEKDATAYRLLIAQVGLDPARTVMIGNSPRSDINPALKAGLCAAVYIPHPHTWELEHEKLDEADDRMMTLGGFQHLLQVF